MEYVDNRDYNQFLNLKQTGGYRPKKPLDIEKCRREMEQLEAARPKYAAVIEQVKWLITTKEANLPQLGRLYRDAYAFEGTKRELKRLKQVCGLLEGDEIDIANDGLDSEIHELLESVKSLGIGYALVHDDMSILRRVQELGHGGPRYPGIAQIDDRLAELRAVVAAEAERTAIVWPRRYRYIGPPRLHAHFDHASGERRYLEFGEVIECMQEPIPDRFELVTEPAETSAAEASATNSAEATV